MRDSDSDSGEGVPGRVEGSSVRDEVYRRHKSLAGKWWRVNEDGTYRKRESWEISPEREEVERIKDYIDGMKRFLRIVRFLGEAGNEEASEIIQERKRREKPRREQLWEDLAKARGEWRKNIMRKDVSPEEAKPRDQKEEADQKIAEVMRSLPKEVSDEERKKVRESLEKQFLPEEKAEGNAEVTIKISGAENVSDNDIVNMVSSALRIFENPTGKSAFTVGDVSVKRETV